MLLFTSVSLRTNGAPRKLSLLNTVKLPLSYWITPNISDKTLLYFMLRRMTLYLYQLFTVTGNWWHLHMSRIHEIPQHSNVYVGPVKKSNLIVPVQFKMHNGKRSNISKSFTHKILTSRLIKHKIYGQLSKPKNTKFCQQHSLWICIRFTLFLIRPRRDLDSISRLQAGERQLWNRPATGLWTRIPDTLLYNTINKLILEYCTLILTYPHGQTKFQFIHLLPFFK